MSMIANNGKKVCFILSNGNVVTKIMKDEKVIWELNGDLLLKFAVDVTKGTTLFRIDNSTEVTANNDYKAGDYLYFSKGTFHPTRVRFYITDNVGYNWYSEIRFLKGFDTSNITNLDGLFGEWANSLQGLSKATVIDVSHFDTSKVTNVDIMFGGCSSIQHLDISNFDTKNVTDFGCLCSGCRSLISLDVSNFDTSSARRISHMFWACRSLTSLDMSGWDTSKVTYMSDMFTYCNSLTNLLFGPKWGTQTSTADAALTLDLSSCGTNKSYKLTDATYNSMLTMYDRASAGLATMTIKFNKKHNIPDGFTEKMTALGYTITLA